jgi:hypothetical protein
MFVFADAGEKDEKALLCGGKELCCGGPGRLHGAPSGIVLIYSGSETDLSVPDPN